MNIADIFQKTKKKSFKMSLFNAEVKLGTPRVSNLLKKNRTTHMTVKPTTLKSQLSTKSSCVELVFHADKDQYLIYQWTRAIEVSCHKTRQQQ